MLWFKRKGQTRRVIDNYNMMLRQKIISIVIVDTVDKLWLLGIVVTLH